VIESRNLIEERSVQPLPEVATVTSHDAEGVQVLQIRPPGAPENAAFLHFHGGGYRLGSPRGSAEQTSRIAKATGIQAFSVKYRLAPENPFPDGLNDAVKAYRWLLDTGIPAERLVFWGDSAGGGLAAAALLRIAQLGLPKAAGAVLFSPWLDLRVAASSYTHNSDSDQLFSRESASEAAENYLAGHDASDPLASPMLGDWAGQPPLLVFVSEIEVLRDDSVLLAKAASDAGSRVRLEKFPETQHMWPIMDYPDTADAVRAVEIVIEFLATELKIQEKLIN
jgi:acetyl esterase/lipase